MAKFKVKDLATTKNIGLGISGVSAGVGLLNFINNSKKRKEDKEYQIENIKAIKKLTDSLNKVDSHLELEKPKQEKKKSILPIHKFFSKTSEYSYKGAVAGGSLSTIIASLFPNTVGKITDKVPKLDKNGKQERNKEGKPIFEAKVIDDPNYKHTKFREKYNNIFDDNLSKLGLTVAGTLIGAGLGALAGKIMDISDSNNRKTTVDARLMKNVVENLKKTNYKEDQDFTRNPKIATFLKTKVCLVISRTGDSLKLLINTVKDSKLSTISNRIIKNLPSMTTVTEKTGDRFNELNLTTMTTNNGDAVWIASIAEKFIKEGYPVYLVEVG